MTLFLGANDKWVAIRRGLRVSGDFNALSCKPPDSTPTEYQGLTRPTVNRKGE